MFSSWRLPSLKDNFLPLWCNEGPAASVKLGGIVLEFFDSSAADNAEQLILERTYTNKHGCT